MCWSVKSVIIRYNRFHPFFPFRFLFSIVSVGTSTATTRHNGQKATGGMHIAPSIQLCHLCTVGQIFHWRHTHQFCWMCGWKRFICAMQWKYGNDCRASKCNTSNTTWNGHFSLQHIYCHAQFAQSLAAIALLRSQFVNDDKQLKFILNGVSRSRRAFYRIKCILNESILCYHRW